MQVLYKKLTIYFIFFRFVSKQIYLFRLFRYWSETPKQTEKQPKQVEFRFVSVLTENLFYLLRGHPNRYINVDTCVQYISATKTNNYKIREGILISYHTVLFKLAFMHYAKGHNLRHKIMPPPPVNQVFRNNKNWSCYLLGDNMGW
jgi:hypothetical protein